MAEIDSNYKFLKIEEIAKNVAEQALDDFLYDGKSIREWMQIIAQEDCISRQSVLDATVKKNSIWNSITNSKGENLEEIISQLPSVKPQEPKWIPVRERLPEDGQSVLFCDIDDDIMVGYHVEGRPVTHFSQDGTYEDMKNVRAWMPLPKPYEPQESEEKHDTDR